VDIRLPKPSEAARILSEALARHGVELKLTQVMEILAHLQGYRNSHAMRAADRQMRGRPQALSATSPDTFILALKHEIHLQVDQITVGIKRQSRSLYVWLESPAPSAPELTSWDTPLIRAADGGDPWVRCENCGWIGHESATNPVRDLFERASPGEICPVGECPRDGAVTHYYPEGPSEEEAAEMAQDGYNDPEKEEERDEPTSSDCDSPRRYVFGHWTHIFLEGTETLTRLCYDRRSNKLVALELKGSLKWHAASPAQITDVEESLQDANPEALEHPEDYGLQEGDDLPDWAASR